MTPRESRRRLTELRAQLAEEKRRNFEMQFNRLTARLPYLNADQWRPLAEDPRVMAALEQLPELLPGCEPVRTKAAPDVSAPEAVKEVHTEPRFDDASLHANGG